MSVIGIEPSKGTMARVLVMPIEGILKKEVGGQVNPDGFYLYRTLSAMYRVILVTYETDHDRVIDWLDKEGIFGYDEVLHPIQWCLNSLESYMENVIRVLRIRGYTVSLVVVNGPGDARDVLSASVPVLMFSQPAYGLPDWLPGSRKGHESWEALVDKVEAERMARLRDKRMEEHVE